MKTREEKRNERQILNTLSFSLCSLPYIMCDFDGAEIGGMLGAVRVAKVRSTKRHVDGKRLRRKEKERQTQ